MQFRNDRADVDKKLAVYLRYEAVGTTQDSQYSARQHFKTRLPTLER